MYWTEREAPDSIFINFESEMDKECALGKEGGSREDFYKFLIGSEYEKGIGGGEKLQIRFLSVFNRN